MIQFYLLSVLLNVTAGYAVYVSDKEPRQGITEGIRAFLRDKSIRLILGILTFMVGFFKLLTVMRLDVPIVGDLLPAAAGMAAGFTLLLEFYRTNATVASDSIEHLEKIFIGYKHVIGIASIAVGVAHFLFANVLFL